MTQLPSPWEPLEDGPRGGRSRDGRPSVGRLILRGAGLALLGLAFATILGLAGAIGVYAYYAAQLPPPQELRQRAAAFKSLNIYDRKGRLLWEAMDPQGGRRTLVRRSQMPQVLVEAVISPEDATFYTNPGWSPKGILRALIANLKGGGIVQGGSTITQQLVKLIYLSDERTLDRKIKEAILASEITRRYTKDEILEIYLNEVYFGNLAYGIEAASETYFSKPVAQLELSEAALLAGIIQAPALYDPYLHPDAAFDRRNTVLRLMLARHAITNAKYAQTKATPLGLTPRNVDMQAPHMVMYVLGLLADQYGEQALYRHGLQVYTTLDLDLQHLAEEVARARLAELRAHGASNAAAVAMDPATGDILAMLGSVDFHRPGDGQVNVTLAQRQPGSAIKPFTYLAAFERGWAPSTMVMDVKQEFPDGANPPYKPSNYDGKEWGAMSVRTALACSRNIPAVSTLQQVGLPALIEMCERLGISSLTRPDYGLALTLGGGEVTLMQLTGAYAALANGGYRVTPRAVLRIEDQTGQVLVAPSAPQLTRAMDPRQAYLITNILADAQARQPAFGADNPLALPFPAAAKTGTTNDYRDSWIVGYTPQMVAGVWMGNNDNTAMDQLSGARGAGFIWNDFMRRALEGAPHPAFVRPEGIVEVEVCPISGQKHTAGCPAAHKDLFLAERAPQECQMHREVAICRASGKLATENCPAESIERRRFEDYGPEWDKWARAHDHEPPPRERCTVHVAQTRVELQAPARALPGLIPVYGATDVPNFQLYYVEFGFGERPEAWQRVTADTPQSIVDGILAQWDATRLPDGVYTLRLVVMDAQGQRREATAWVHLEQPTPEPAPTEMLPTPTMPAPTETPWPTPTLQAPTETPMPTFEPTATSEPSVPPTEQPTPTETPIPIETPTPTLEPTPSPTTESGPVPLPPVIPSTGG